ncbi:MFS transporter [Paenibacillus thalictri]|uniref:MFS transporter n=2 Tax=Paenibacillus thalictri TaxID=2527873 RepID=A0A4Q9DR51_9BACL|nr:MFS transporter [Paenibacillus thalictri]
MVYFLLYYVVAYMGNAVYGTFVPVYFSSVGCSPAQIGILLSMGPIVAILAQPMWGTAGDRAAKKNTVLAVLLIGSAAASLLMPLSSQFYYLVAVVCFVAFFQTSITSLSDAITLEELDKHKKWSFGSIRMGGTIGYALMSVIFGFIAKDHVGFMFPIYAAVMLLAFMLLLRFPKIAGYQTLSRKMNMWALFRNRTLVLYMSVSFVLQITLGYYYSFFPLYFKEMGGDNALLGWSMLISSLSEIPFLLFSHKLLKKIPIQYILLGAGAVTCLRWVALYYIHNPYAAISTQILHGLMFIVLTVSLATYVNREVPRELKASGQTLNGLINQGIARIIGSFFGGFASEWLGMRNMFLLNALIALGCIIVFAVIIFKRERPASGIPFGGAS